MVNTPEEVILKGLFAFKVGLARVKLPVLLMKTPPAPVVSVMVPVEVVDKGELRLPMPPVLVVGTVKAIAPMPVLIVPAVCVIELVGPTVVPVKVPPKVVTAAFNTIFSAPFKITERVPEVDEMG